MSISPILMSDFYKSDHRRQYPVGTTEIYSNFTPRASRLPEVNHLVVFGIQYFCREFLQRQFNDNFFSRPKKKVLSQYKYVMDNALGKDAFPLDHLSSLHDLGYLPIKIKALPEGTLCPLRVPVLTVVNTLPQYFWLTNFIESLLSNVLWHPMTCATIAREYRKIADRYAEETSDDIDFVKYQCHDFSFRGHTHPEAAAAGGAAHLLSFVGTDTISSIPFLCDYYDAEPDKELVGCSISATEHSVQSIHGEDGEFETYKRLLTEVYPKGNVSIVSDTYNLWRVLTEYLPKLKDIILNRDGKTIIRPDSGNPEKIICGDNKSTYGPEKAGVVKLLYEEFGGRINHKGYHHLHPKLGTIYGDSITTDRFIAICEGLKRNLFASTCAAEGVGSFSYQYLTRDTFGFAFKTTSAVVNGQRLVVYKDPVTDDGVKRSARGLLMVTCDPFDKSYQLVENVSEEQEGSAWNMLRTVFCDSKLYSQTTLREIRQRLEHCNQ